MLVSQILRSKGDTVFTVAPDETIAAVAALLHARRVGRPGGARGRAGGGHRLRARRGPGAGRGRRRARWASRSRAT